jgi:hypothetical protein
MLTVQALARGCAPILGAAALGRLSWTLAAVYVGGLCIFTAVMEFRLRRWKRDRGLA